MHSRNIPTISRRGFSSTLTVTVLALIFLLSFAITVQTVQAAGPNGDMSLISTPNANLRTLAGDCMHLGPNAICQEVCLVTQSGHVIPQGNFVCIVP